jgi:hypothetical protein
MATLMRKLMSSVRWRAAASPFGKKFQPPTSAAATNSTAETVTG